MKRVYCLLALVLCLSAVQAQWTPPTNYVKYNSRIRYIAFLADSTFHIPYGVTPSLRGGGWTGPGAMFFNTTDSSGYFYTGYNWRKMGNPTPYVDSVYNRNDSVFYRYDSTEYFVADVSGSGAPVVYVDSLYRSNDSLYWQKDGNTYNVGRWQPYGSYVGIGDTMAMLAPYVKDAGWGLIKGTQSLRVDSGLVTSRAWLYKVVDSLDAIATIDTHFGNTDLTATGNRSHDWNGYDYVQDSIGQYVIRSNQTGTTTGRYTVIGGKALSQGFDIVSKYDSDDYAGLYINNSNGVSVSYMDANAGSKYSGITVHPDSISLYITEGNLSIEGILDAVSDTTGFKPLAYNPVTKRVVKHNYWPEGGINALAAIGSSPNANGATISGNTLTLQPASASFGGIVTDGTQTFAGSKTFNSTLTVNSFSSFLTGALTSSFSTTGSAWLAGASNVVDSRVNIKNTSGVGTTINDNSSYGTTFITGDNPITEGASGTHNLVSNLLISPLTFNAGAASTTNAATVYIRGSAVGTATPTNNYAMWVDSGDVRLDGPVIMGGLPTTEQAYVLMADASGNVHRVDTTGMFGGGGGSGNVTKVGTPVDNQIGVWTGDGTIEGDANFTWTGTALNADGAAVFNETGNNVDFRVEGDTDPNTLFVDASADRVGVGTNAPTAKLDVYDATNGDVLILRNSSITQLTVNGSTSSFVYLNKNSNDQTASYVIVPGSSFNDANPFWHMTTVGGSPNYVIREQRTAGVYEERFHIEPSGAAVFNEPGNDRDFRIESDGDVNAFFVDAGNNRVGILNGAPAVALDVTGEIRASTAGTNAASVVTNAGTQTLTNKRVTPRTGTVASSATPTINTDNVDFFSITAQTVDITSMTTNLSGTPTDGQKLWIAITGTAARLITWGTSFEASTVALPTTTVSTNRLDCGFIWNAATSKWRIVATQ